MYVMELFLQSYHRLSACVSYGHNSQTPHVTFLGIWSPGSGPPRCPLICPDLARIPAANPFLSASPPWGVEGLALQTQPMPYSPPLGLYQSQHARAFLPPASTSPLPRAFSDGQSPPPMQVISSKCGDIECHLPAPTRSCP